MASEARFVVTGCARSGTSYTTLLLARAGADCTHEQEYQPDRVRARLRGGDVSCFAASRLPIPVPVVWQLRPPLDVIGSLVGTGVLERADVARATARAARHVYTGHPAGAQRAAAYWLAWNALIEPHADLTWRLPLAVGDVTGLSDLAGLGLDPEQVRWALRRVPFTVNAHPRSRRVELAELGDLAGPVAEAAERYGLSLRSAPSTS